MPLTWREVAAPNFSGVSEAQRLAGTFMSNGFQSAIDALSGLGKDQMDRERNTLLNEGTRLDNQNQTLQNNQLGWTNDQIRAFEAGRPAAVDRVNQIRSFAADGTPEGRAKAAELQRQSSQIFAAAGWTPDQVNAQINGNLGTNVSGLALNKAHQEFGDANVSREEGLAAKALVADVLKTAGSPAEAERMIRGNANISPTVASIALDTLGSKGSTLFGPNVDMTTAIIEESLRGRQGGGNSLIGLVDRTEGAGNYDTLYGHTQRDGSPFAGVRVSQQTIGELKKFSAADGPYGQHQKSQLGYVATPMGRFQIVGDTLRQTAEEMGLSDDTVFSEDVQNAMFEHLVNKRLSGPKSMDGKMAGLRQEWEGFKNVSDADLSAAITAYESGDRSALTGISGNGSSAPAAPPNTVDTAIAAALQATQSQPGGLEAVVNRTNALGNQAQTILNSVAADGMLGNQALLTELSTRPNQGKAEIDLAHDLMKRINTDENDTLISNPNDVITKINEVKSKYGLDSDMAAAFIAESVRQNPWGTRWLLGQTSIDDTGLDRLIAQYYNKDGKTPQEKLAPAIEQLTASQVKRSAVDTIQTLQGQLVQAQQALANARERAKTRGGVDVDAYELQVAALQNRLEQANLAADSNPLVRSNTFAKR